jgi:carboxyl-terminal processing protease
VASHPTQVLDEATERIEDDYYRPIATSQLSNAGISAMVASLNDRFSHYLSPSEYREFIAPPHFTGIGVSVATQLAANRGLLIERVFNSSPAARAGLRPGDVIVAVNGHKLERLTAEAATTMIRGLPGTNVQLGVELAPEGHSRRAVMRTVKITRAIVSEPVVESVTRTVHAVKLGVVALASFSPGSHVEVREAVEHELHAGARGLVFDLRDNGGGLVQEAQLIASIFIPNGVIVTTRGRTVPTQVLYATGGAISASIPMVVLVDSNTASSSEIVTAALQDHHRATVVGTHTFGKGVFQEEQPLANGGALDITVGEYFTPDGRNLGGGGVKQGAGVIPEVRVPSNAVDTNRGLEVALSTLAAKVK